MYLTNQFLNLIKEILAEEFPKHKKTKAKNVCLVINNCCGRAILPFTSLWKSFGRFNSEFSGKVAAAWLTFVESCKLQKKATLEVFNGYFQRIAQGRRDYDLILDEVLC